LANHNIGATDWRPQPKRDFSLSAIKIEWKYNWFPDCKQAYQTSGVLSCSFIFSFRNIRQDFLKKKTTHFPVCSNFFATNFWDLDGHIRAQG
jgi:hypothetical protein